MIRVYSKNCLFFRKFLRNRTAVIVNLLFLILVYPHVTFGNDDVARRFSELEAQYKGIKTVYLKSQILKKYYPSRFQEPTSNTAEIYQMTYEYWADDHGHYRGHSFFAASENDPENDIEFAVNGKLWQGFNKTAGLFVYDTKEFKGTPPYLENSLFSPLSFLSREDDNCPGCVLHLEDVLNAETWNRKLASARIVTAPDQAQGQVVVEIPGGILIGKAFVYHVYFSDKPDFLPAKISWVDETGRTFKSLEFVYNATDLDGKQTYWAQSVRLLGMPIAGTETIIYDLNVKTEFLEINQELPPDIFTLDISSAETIWDDNLKLFIKQKGGF